MLEKRLLDVTKALEREEKVSGPVAKATLEINEMPQENPTEPPS